MDKHGRPKTTSTPAAYVPAQIRTAYGFNSTALSSETGSGETIAIVDAYDDPTIEYDLGQFKSAYSITGCTLKEFNETGGAKLPSADAGWALEISLDVEWACAIAPGANIVLVEANSNSFSDLMTAVQTATSIEGANVVSMSWGGSEFSGETSYDTSTFAQSKVTFTAASGDGGAGVIYPAASPYVVGVGGTSLPLRSDGSRSGSETAWSGSGGGVSAYETRPQSQSELLSSPSYSGDLADAGSQRGVPDVAYDANPSYGFSVYDSTPYNGQSGWFIVGGTSAGAPQWAALYALADEAASSPSALGSATYAAAEAGLSTATGVESNFTDITSGQNCSGHGPKAAICQAVVGYDFVTGLGSPLAGSLVQALK